MSFPETETLTSIVAREFRVEDVTLGDQQRGFMARYRGQLINEDSAAAYDRMSDALGPYRLTPLFRVEDGKQVVYLVSKVPDPPIGNPTTNIVLFALTVVSVMLAGVEVPAKFCNDLGGWMSYSITHILSGWPYAVSLLSILLAHEFGHYFMSRYRKTPATLPYFIPLPPPVGVLGTMGAAILLRGNAKNKRVLFDIGVAGPLAGLIVAIPVLFLGLSLSHLDKIVMTSCGISLEGNSIVYLLAKYITFGKLLPAPAGAAGFAYWVRYFFTGHPIPIGGTDVFIHPVAFAGWAGLLVTALNLVPVGTLDGGHVIYGLIGDKASKAYPYIIAVLILLGLIWSGWWLWAFLLLWLGRVRAQPLDQITTLDAPRRALGIAVLIIFVLVFTPIPFSVFSG